MNRLISRSLITAFALFLLFCVPSIASADGIVNWTLSANLQDLGFTGPGTTGMASGSFAYDLGTNTFSDIHITTPATLGFAGATYTSLINAFGGSSSTGMILGMPGDDLTGTAILFLMFDGAGLTNSGGPVSLMGVGEGTCNNMTCSSPTELRLVTSGGLIGTPVATPEPSTFSLMGMGLVALLAGAAIRKVLLA
jgi:PEP-CTERM motif